MSYLPASNPVIPAAALIDTRLTLRDCRFFAVLLFHREPGTGLIEYPGREAMRECEGQFLPPDYMFDGIIEKLIGCGYLIVVGHNKFRLGRG